jgi:hypothetical protein
MTELLEKAFSQASRLPQEEQDALAKWILKELASEHRWNEAFARSQDTLEHMADEALAEYRAGRTQELNPDDVRPRTRLKGSEKH